MGARARFTDQLSRYRLGAHDTHSGHIDVTLKHPPPRLRDPPPWTLDCLRFPMDPLMGGGWTLDFLESPRYPPGGGVGLWTFWEVQGTLHAGHNPLKNAQNYDGIAKNCSLAALARATLSPGGGVGLWTFWKVPGTLQWGWVGLWNRNKCRTMT